MNVQHSQQSFETATAPVMQIYLDYVEAWKRSYEAMAGNTAKSQAKEPAYSSEAAKSDHDSALDDWKKSSEDIFQRFVEQQVEICRFFARRWEQFGSLPVQLAHCQTAAEIGQAQMAFLTQFTNDYLCESGKLAAPMAGLMAKLVTPPHA